MELGVGMDGRQRMDIESLRQSVIAWQKLLYVLIGWKGRSVRNADTDCDCLLLFVPAKTQPMR